MFKYRLSREYSLTEYTQYHYNHIDAEKIQYLYNQSIIYQTATELNKTGTVVVSYETPNGIYTTRIFKKHLELVETTLPDNMVWGKTRNRVLQFDSSYLLEQIRTRYAFFDRPTNGLSNIIIDNYAPKLLYNTRFDQKKISLLKLPKTIYAISPWFAQYFGAHQIPTEQLCRILGYDLKTLKQLITKVKHKNWSISFIGYGGTNVNTIHWLTEIMKATQSVNLFKFIEVYEPETAEISNLLRFPKNPYIENSINYDSYVTESSKLKLLEPSEISLLSRTKAVIKTDRINGDLRYYSSKGMKYGNGRFVLKNNHIFYGAPTIDTRESFKDVGHFISATHNGNSAHLWVNPVQDSDLQVESYGLIQLTPFFMNQLRLAIGLLETLANNSFDPKARDELLLEYSFDGASKLPTNKTYNFQLEHSGLVTTETEAETEW
jgi:hypothetical protein